MEILETLYKLGEPTLSGGKVFYPIIKSSKIKQEVMIFGIKIPEIDYINQVVYYEEDMIAATERIFRLNEALKTKKE